ncbi:uncharacterized protein [Argopecten irradians]|uniref:uncharacterized protein isoform X1 n=1 Tax=Argopecten irradians TaxID=31199 RepID=UPI00371EE057
MNSYIAIALVLCIAVAQVQSQGNTQSGQQAYKTNTQRPAWGNPVQQQRRSFGFGSMLNNPVAMSMFLSGNMPDSLQDILQMNMAGNLLSGGMGQGINLQQMAALSFLEGM